MNERAARRCLTRTRLDILGALDRPSSFSIVAHGLTDTVAARRTFSQEGRRTFPQEE